jgi:protein TonB
MKYLRPAIFLVVAALHVGLLFGVVFTVTNTAPVLPAPLAAVMKLMDVMEYVPAPPPPPQEVSPPPAPTVAGLPAPQAANFPVPLNAVEAIAENVIETDQVPDVTVVAPGTLGGIGTLGGTGVLGGTGTDYLPMNRISVPPVFQERQIRDALVYPLIAQRSGVEGTVYLELYVDKEGVVQRVTVLKETPPDRGFAEAAVKAFQNIRGTPAQANGVAVPVRYRYPVRFSIRK